MFAAFDAERYEANEKDVVWAVRIGTQRLPKNFSIGYVLFAVGSKSAKEDTPRAVGFRVPKLDKLTERGMRIVALDQLLSNHYGMSPDRMTNPTALTGWQALRDSA